PKNNTRQNNNYYRGFYEGSIFYGSRFYDFQKIDDALANPVINSLLRDADDFVKDSMSLILHGDKTHYRTLKKIVNKQKSVELGFKGMPYFFVKDSKLISQFSMSSGESMLISLIDFVNNIMVRNKPQRNQKILFLVDEVELALHPSAIDRLVAFFKDLSQRHNLLVYFSTHSSEVIQKIEAKNIYLIENFSGEISCTNPCYPNYAIRNLYVPNGFDYIILVEDELAKAVVEKSIREQGICQSKLWCVLPSGGWSQTLKLHRDIVKYNALGVGKKIVSIYDGDVINDVSGKYEFKDLPKAFLPIPSIEKYLLKKIYIEKDRIFIKTIGDKYFTQKPLRDIANDYGNDPRSARDRNGKHLYNILLKHLEKNGIEEMRFVRYLCEDITKIENFSSFNNTLTSILG
ncbi:ATP-binding protein, partial [Desulfovibrio sp. OttesenSCG-928-A18]|nr:ATP-binding protein [Desulfovibrio sp. OttesenSCG-928-A18]